MDIAFLALLCKVYRLSWDDFHFLKNRKDSEIREFIAIKKKVCSPDLQSSIKEWHQKHLSWSHYPVLHPAHPLYPRAFVHVPEPPVYLTYSGDIHFLTLPQVSVVGSRTPHFRFLEWLEVHFATFLKDKDISVASGGAIGVDQKASRLALAEGVPTVQFLPSGLDAIYPRNIQSWRDDSRVLCLSEYLPTQSMMRHHFLVRNRLVAAIGEFLFVVQAALKSGSMITTRYAIDFGKEVATLPDFPGIAESSGNLAMIKDGAQIIQTAADLNTLYERLGLGLMAPGPNGQNQKEEVGQPEGNSGMDNHLC